MEVGFLITDHGTHSPEKWSAVSAGQIITIATTAAGEQAVAGRRLELKLMDILETHHKAVQDEEKATLEVLGHEQYNHPIDPTKHVDKAFAEILSASEGTPFASHFQREDVKAHVYEVVRKDMSSVIDIERSWHRDLHK